jgi:hypothetical protein
VPWRDWPVLIVDKFDDAHVAGEGEHLLAGLAASSSPSVERTSLSPEIADIRTTCGATPSMSLRQTGRTVRSRIGIDELAPRAFPSVRLTRV